MGKGGKTRKLGHNAETIQVKTCLDLENKNNDLQGKRCRWQVDTRVFLVSAWCVCTHVPEVPVSWYWYLQDQVEGATHGFVGSPSGVWGVLPSMAPMPHYVHKVHGLCWQS